MTERKQSERARQLDLLGGELTDPHAAAITWLSDTLALAPSARALDALLDPDVRVVVDLTTDDERAETGTHALDAGADARGLAMIRLPIPPGCAPDERADAVMERVEDHRTAGEAVLLISRDGGGRAVTIAAALRIRAGAALDDALSDLLTSCGAAPSSIQRAWLEELAQHVEAAIAVDDGEEGAGWRDDPRDVGVTSFGPPRARPLGPRASANAGAVLGAAIGDAMGHPTEFLSLEAIRAKWPPAGVTGFELYWEREGARFAPYTDDTQMAEAVLRSLLWARREGADLDRAMQHMAQAFVDWAERPQGGHRAPGNACLAGARALASGEHWSRAGGASAGGCGSVMRAYPFGLLFAHDLSRCEEWAVAHSKLTHRDPIALAASAAMAVGVARVVRGEPTRVVLSEMIAAAARQSARTAAMMAEALDDADRAVPPEQTLDRLRGWAAHEAIAAAVYLFARSPDDPARALLEGANSPGDSDSLATLAGALAGARGGLGALPEAWVRDVERSEALQALALEI